MGGLGMKRFVVLRIDDIYRMLKDYAGEALGLPEDAWPTKFRSVAGKLDLMLEAESWQGEQPAEEIKFDMRRVYGVGSDGGK
jgi:hypothetical protein